MNQGACLGPRLQVNFMYSIIRAWRETDFNQLNVNRVENIVANGRSRICMQKSFEHIATKVEIAHKAQCFTFNLFLNHDLEGLKVCYRFKLI